VRTASSLAAISNFYKWPSSKKEKKTKIIHFKRLKELEIEPTSEMVATPSNKTPQRKIKNFNR
jgi:hypothetical protein